MAATDEGGGRALEHRAYALRREGDAAAALTEYRRAAAMYHADDDPRGEAHAIRHAADILTGMNRLDEADAFYEEALALYDRHGGDDLDVGNAVRAYAVLRDRQGRSSSTMWQRALGLYETVGVAAGIEECRARLA